MLMTRPRPDTGALTDTIAQIEGIAKLFVIQDNGCWNWAKLNSQGYGYLVPKSLGKQSRAHRYMFELIKGPIPNNILDHLCRNTACVNPFHLDAVNDKINVLRGESFAAVNSKLQQCLRGHDLIGNNVRVNPRGHRVCLECQRIRSYNQWLKNTHGRVSRHVPDWNPPRDKQGHFVKPTTPPIPGGDE